MFVTSGMQKHKDKFIGQDVDTIFDIQRCLRMNDYTEIGDNTHYLVFDMIGMFSFRELSIQQTIDFWLGFLTELDIHISYVTIHPDKPEWVKYYPSNIKVVELEENKWSDGNIGGYCTEFFVGDVEIGNIVNPLGTCIDVGFGLQRLLNIKYDFSPPTKLEVIQKTCETLISSGVVPGSNKQQYILRKLLIDLLYIGGSIDHRFFDDIKSKQQDQYTKYLREKIKPKHKNKNSFYWLDTYGIDETDLDKYKILF